MEYLINNSKYSLSYRDLQEKHQELSHTSLEEFLNRLPEVLHLAVIISWLKELGNDCLSDEGIIHQIAHLIHLKDEPVIDAREIKKQFETELKL